VCEIIKERKAPKPQLLTSSSCVTTSPGLPRVWVILFTLAMKNKIGTSSC